MKMTWLKWLAVAIYATILLITSAHWLWFYVPLHLTIGAVGWGWYWYSCTTDEKNIERCGIYAGNLKYVTIPNFVISLIIGPISLIVTLLSYLGSFKLKAGLRFF